MQIGRVCIKIAGRDAGELAVVISEPEGNYVLIDGNVRRKKCNIKHLEPTSKTLDIDSNASTSDVLKAMEKAGLKVVKKAEKKAAKEPKTVAKPKKTAEKKAKK